MLNLAIFLTLAAGLLIFLKWYVRTEIIDPVFFTSAYWIGFILFSVLLSLNMGFVFYWVGVVPVMLLLLAFVAGGFVMKQLMKRMIPDESEEKNKLKKHSLSLNRIFWLIMVFSGLGLLAIYMQLDYLQIHIQNLSELLHTANRISVIRYNGGQEMPKMGLVLMAFLYSAGFLGGVYSVVSKQWLSKIISLLPFVVMLIFTVINGVKTGFLFLLVIWVSGFAAAYVYEKKGEIQRLGSLAVKVLIIVFMVLLLIPLTQVMRGGRTDGKITYVNAGALSYFGSFNAFSVWYHSYNNDELTGGKYTLSGVHNFFYGEREVGLYGDQNVTVGVWEGNPIRTNVYTMTRGLIEDFTLFGAIAVLFLSGIIMQLVYESARRRNALAMGVLALFYSILLWSFTANLINYNTLILSWIISLLVIFYIRKQRKTVHTITEE